MATTVRRLTYDDLEAIPQDRPGDRHELIDGKLFVTPSPIPVHQIVSRNIFRALDAHVEQAHLGAAFYAPVDIRLTPDNVLVPDIFFLSQERLHIIGPKAVDAAPDLVIEILSPGTRRRDLHAKRDLNARFGVSEYWIVDPDATTVTVLSLTDGHYQQLPVADDGAVSSRVLPGLAPRLERVFADV